MSLHDKKPLNSRRRRLRKAQLARRDGQCCAYCRLPFASLREAALDHVVPIRLFTTWSAGHLVLACRRCNSHKGDRLPLSLALTLCATFSPMGVDVASTPIDPTVTPVDRTRDALALWRLLARLAADHERALTSVTVRVTAVSTGVTPDCDARRPADPTGERSTPCLRRSTRPDRLRAPRPVRTCPGRPPGSAVYA